MVFHKSNNLVAVIDAGSKAQIPMTIDSFTREDNK